MHAYEPFWVGIFVYMYLVRMVVYVWLYVNYVGKIVVL